MWTGGQIFKTKDIKNKLDLFLSGLFLHYWFSISY